MITLNNIDIFICAHKNFNKYPINPVYKIVCGEDDKIENKKIAVIKEGNNKYSPVQHSLCEMSRIYWIWKNYPLKKYVGFCHYRRYFEFYDVINYNKLNKIFNVESSVIVTPHQSFVHNKHTAYDVYNQNHIIEDYEIIKKIIHNKHNISYDMLDKYDKIKYGYNMFIMNVNDFNKYCEFVFSIFDEYILIRNFNNMSDIENYINKNLHKIHDDSCYGLNMFQQTRIIGFLSECISSIFFQWYFKHIVEMNFLITDEKKLAKIKSIRRGI